MGSLTQDMLNSFPDEMPHTYVDELGREVPLINEFSIPPLAVPELLEVDDPDNYDTSHTETILSPDIGTDFRNPMYFRFNDDRLHGTGLIPANESSRFRAMVHAISAEAEEYGDITVEEASIRLKNLKEFIGGIVTLNKVKMRRDKVIPYDLVFEELEAEIADDNTPSWQAFKQLERDYPDIGAGIVRVIKRSVLGSLHAETIKSMYDTKIEEIKNPAKDKPA